MTDEEQAILAYLEGSPETFFARREIARRAVKRRVFEENPHWADAPLASLVAGKLVIQNDSGHFAIKRSAAFD
jgi:hypothetical protein